MCDVVSVVLGTRLDNLRSVLLHVVIRLKIRANLDAPGAST